MLLSLLFCLPLLIYADLGDEGKQIIMQTDIETVVITTPLRPTKDQIRQLLDRSQQLQTSTATDKGNELGKRRGRVNKAIYNILLANSLNVQHTAKKFNDVFQSYSNTEKDKRAIEILGSFLSSLTGVPSARDHRQIVEQIKMVRIESKGIENLLKDQNEENSKILQTFHFHSNKMKSIDNNLGKLQKETAVIEADIMRVLAVLGIVSKTQQAVGDIAEIISTIKEVISFSDQDRLSRKTITEKTLGQIIDEIYLRRTGDNPIFGRQNCAKYFELPLAHSWLNKEAMELTTLLQIPIAKLHETARLAVLDMKNLVHSDLPLAVIDYRANQYRYLSQSDLDECIDIGQTKACQKREIRILPRIGCNIELGNCEKWTTSVAHDITNSDILIISDTTENATLSCDNQPDRLISIPSRAIMTLDISCSLASTNYTISKLSYRHLRQTKSDIATHITFDVTEEARLLKPDLKVTIHKLVDDTRNDVEGLIAQNRAIKEKIGFQISESNTLWENIDAGKYPWEQLLEWGIITGLGVLLIALGAWVLKLQIKQSIMRRRSGRGGINAERVEEIMMRVMDLETSQQITSIVPAPRGTSTPESID